MAMFGIRSSGRFFLSIKNGQQLLNDLIHGETYILGGQSPVERLLSRIQGPFVFAVLF